jgi:hypothetical protein
LFRHLDIAQIFRQVSNQRVREHAPFFVFKLYRIYPRQAFPDCQ